MIEVSLLSAGEFVCPVVLVSFLVSEKTLCSPSVYGTSGAKNWHK